MEEDFKNFTRVTKILSYFQDLSHIPEEVLERKGALGSRVHDLIEKCFSRKEYIVEGDSLPYFCSFLKWKDDADPDPIVVEKRFFDEHLKITGKVDLILKMPGEDGGVLCDFKTSAQPNDLVWELQGGFYWMMAAQHYILSERFLFISLKKSGAYKVHEYRFSSDLKDLCLAVLATYRHFN